MIIRKGDKVIVISGTDRGKTGKVEAVFPGSEKLVVGGINVKKRHQRRTKSNQKGQIVDKAMPIFASKVMLVGQDGKGTRVGFREIGGKKVRISVKTEKEI